MVDRWDILVIAGALVIVIGVSLIHPPSAVILLGLFLVAAGVLGSWQKGRDAPEEGGEE